VTDTGPTTPALSALVREFMSAGIRSEDIALKVGLSANQLDHRLRLEGTGIRKIANEWKAEHQDKVNAQVRLVIESKNGEPARESLATWRRFAKRKYSAGDTQKKFVLCCTTVFKRSLKGDRLRSIERESGFGRVMVLSAYDVVRPHIAQRRQEIATGVLPLLSSPTVCERDARAFEFVYCKAMQREVAAKDLAISLSSLNATLERIAKKIPPLKGLVIRKAEPQDIDTVKEATRLRREAQLSELHSFLKSKVPFRFRSSIGRASRKKINKELQWASHLANAAPAIEAAVDSSGVAPRLARTIIEALFYNSAFLDNPTGGAIALRDLSDFISTQLRTYKIARSRHGTIFRKLAYPSFFKANETNRFEVDREKVLSKLQEISNTFKRLEKAGAALKIPTALGKTLAAHRMLETRLTPERAKVKIRSDWTRVVAVKEEMEALGHHPELASGIALSVYSMANPLSSWRTALEKGMNHIERQVRRFQIAEGKSIDEREFWSTLLSARSGDASARRKVLFATSDVVTSNHFSVRFLCFGILQEILFDSPLPPLKENTFVKLLSYISLTLSHRLRFDRTPGEVEKDNSNIAQLGRTITSYLLARELATSSHRFGSKKKDSISRIPIKNLQRAYQSQLRGDEAFREALSTPELAITVHSAAVALRAQAAMCLHLIKACPELSEAAIVFEHLALRHRTPQQTAQESGLSIAQVQGTTDALLKISPLLSRFFINRVPTSQLSKIEEGIEDVLVEAVSIARTEGAIDLQYLAEIVSLALSIPDFLTHTGSYCRQFRLVTRTVSKLPINNEGKSLVFRSLASKALKHHWSDEQVCENLEQLVTTLKTVTRFLPDTLDPRIRDGILAVLSVNLVPSDDVVPTIKKVEHRLSKWVRSLEKEGHPSSVARAVSLMALHTFQKRLSLDSAIYALTHYERIRIACSYPGWRNSPVASRIHQAWQLCMKSSAQVTHELIEVFALINEGEAVHHFPYGFLCELRLEVLSESLRNPHARKSFEEFVGYCAAYYRYKLAEEGTCSLSDYRESLRKRFSSSPRLDSLDH